MHRQSARIAGRILAAAAAGGTAALVAASPGHAATTTATQAAAAKAKYIQASGYTGKKVHATWAGPSVGVSSRRAVPAHPCAHTLPSSFGG